MKIPGQNLRHQDLHFVHSYLDEYRLNLHEWRLYGHLVRRANGKGWANPGITSMSEICGMKRNTVVRTIRSLEARGMIRVTRTNNKLSEYILTDPCEWKRPGETGIPLDTSIPNGTSILSDTGAVSRTAQTPVPLGILKGNPREGNPLKDNTVARPSDPTPTLPPSPVAPSQEPCLSGGSLPDGKPAVFRRYAEGDSVSEPGKPSQTPTRRKAYAMADYLAHFHWDNCKVRFVKETARSYAEKALCDGHEDSAIFAAYDKTLRYCHRLTTDEMCRGERHQGEKATPALTVWLARDRLSGDPRTVEERWKVVIARLTAEKRKQIEEEARIRHEIAEKAPEIKAWFANNLNRGASTAGQVSILEMERGSVAA